MWVINAFCRPTSINFEFKICIFQLVDQPSRLNFVKDQQHAEADDEPSEVFVESSQQSGEQVINFQLPSSMQMHPH